MGIDEYQKEIEKVQNYYGREYNEIQVQEIYRYFQNVSFARFKYVISKLYEKTSRLPLLADYVETHRSIPYTRINGETPKTENCKKCEGRGYILYTKLDKATGIKYEFMAHCVCKKGLLEYCYDGTKLKDPRNRTKYYIPSILEIIPE